MGQSNKAIGQSVIDRLAPLPKESGSGAGAKVRPSADRARVLLRAGGGHRKQRRQQWGKRFVPRSNPRPFILGTALRQQDQIEREYLDGIKQAFKPAVWKVK